MHTNEYDEDYEEEQAIEFRAILDEEDKLLHHSSCTRSAPSIARTSLPSIDNTFRINRILQCREDSNSRGVRSKTPTSAQP
ncbi:hypothetical protein F2Q69_00047521 [Brassica cretica]|uniref:Uncharacterized protein n=1 Tax=Brassica cretica TaxID=69181 RepID=A0A8S9PRG2_BRACR|nr:hypothetical protein F2Q69_00047521 [Brassica cretica]